MYVYGMVGWILFGDQAPGATGATSAQAMLTTFTMLTLENWPALLEAGLAIHPGRGSSSSSYVLLASFLVINILIAIIINSMEEVHRSERDERAADLRADARGRRPGRARRSWTDWLTLRMAIDDLEADLEAIGLPAEARTRVSRPTKGGRMRA